MPPPGDRGEAAHEDIAMPVPSLVEGMPEGVKKEIYKLNGVGCRERIDLKIKD
jgi:hypothetical protein